MNYYNEIKNKIIKSEIYDRVKDYSKNKSDLDTYYKVGKMLSEAGKEYCKNIIKQYSEKLMVEFGKKYNERNLRYMRQFYEIFSSIKWNPVGSKLNWSHFRELLIVKDINAIMYYINICEINNLTRRQLQERIKNTEYKIRIGDRYNYIDLLLFNIEYNCYVVIELKVRGLKKEYIGQIQVYMNYYNEIKQEIILILPLTA